MAVGDEYADDTVRAAVWSSPDGVQWARVHDDAFDPGRMWHVGATDQGIVAFGDDCFCIYSKQWLADGKGRRVIWTSTDGRDWLRATNETGLAVASGVRTLVRVGGGLTAFVHDADSVDAAARPVEVWRTRGRAEWAKVGELPGSEGADVFQAAQGPRGWVAAGGTEAGETMAWSSADGVAWDVSPTAPGKGSVLADRDGFVAVGARGTSTGCAEPPGAFVGQTWTSSDGRVWRETPSQDDWVGDAISELLVRERTVIGVGLSFADDSSGRVDGAIWTTTLPTASLDAGATPQASAPPSPSQGCGP